MKFLGFAQSQLRAKIVLLKCNKKCLVQDCLHKKVMKRLFKQGINLLRGPWGNHLLWATVEPPGTHVLTCVLVCLQC